MAGALQGRFLLLRNAILSLNCFMLHASCFVLQLVGVCLTLRAYDLLCLVLPLLRVPNGILSSVYAVLCHPLPLLDILLAALAVISQCSARHVDITSCCSLLPLLRALSSLPAALYFMIWMLYLGSGPQNEYLLLRVVMLLLQSDEDVFVWPGNFEHQSCFGGNGVGWSVVKCWG
jgi:hypothetical protein